jgi:tripartite-type tricarboxylate transporter receptor subunit TctC
MNFRAQPMQGWRSVLIASSFVFGAAVSAQDYPSRPVRIVTSEVGGGNDVQARMIAQGLSIALNQQFIVENRPSGPIPGEIVSKSNPNGYTLLLFNNALWVGPLIQTTPYDPIRDFAPVTSVTRAVNLVVVHPSSPVKSVQELIALAKAKPGELNYGASGTGSSNHLAAELFKSMAGINIVRVNYKGAGPALTALIAGEVQLMVPTAGAATPHVKAGRIRVLAVTSAEPSAFAPGIPTVAASGVPGYEAVTLYSVFVPAATPRPIIDKLNGEIVRLLKRPEMMEKLTNAGLEPAGSTPSQLAAIVKTETERMSKVIKASGIRGD